MDNNDILIRLRYALDIKDTDMMTIFKLGGHEYTKDEIKKILTKTNDHYHDERDSHYDIIPEENIHCTTGMLEAFLDGFIIFKRGASDQENHIETKPKTLLLGEAVNNEVLKKVKIALALTSEEVLDIFKLAGLGVTKGELGSFLRRQGHKNYKVMGDKYTRHFLKGLGLRNRG